jgi:O-antigen ligase
MQQPTDIRVHGWTKFAAICLGASAPAVFLGKVIIAGFAGFAAIAALIGMVRYRDRSFNFRTNLKSPLTMIISIVALSWLVSSVISIDPAKSLITWLRTYGILGIGWLFVDFLSRHPKVLNLALQSLITVSLLIHAAAAFALYINPAPFELFALLKDGTPNLVQTLKPYASVTVCLIPILLWAGWRLASIWKILTIITLCLATLTLYSKAIQPSTSAIFGLLGSAILVSIVWGIQKLSRFWAWSCIVILVLGLMVLAVFIIEHLPAPPFNFFQLIDEDVQPKLSVPDWHRQVIWGFTLECIKEFPFFGVGPNTVNLIPGADTVIPFFNQEYIPSHPHNWFLEIAAETGIIGLATFLIGLALSHRTLALSAYRGSGPAWAAIMLFGVFWISSLGNFSIWSAWWLTVFATLMSFPLAALKLDKLPN